MRYLMAMILLGSLGVGALAADYRPLDKQAVDAIEKISAIVARDNNLSGEKETEFFIKLSKAARTDRKTEDALVFGMCANNVLKASSYGDKIFDLLTDTGGSQWNDLQTMARRYKGDGVLSAVNYKALTAPDGSEKLRQATDWVPEEHQIEATDVLDAYKQARRNGLTPQEAYAKVHAHDPTSKPPAGLALMEKGLHRIGNVTLTGYDATSAHKDVPAFLEAKYAFSNPSAPDIRGVMPAVDPMEFIGNKVIDAIHRDNRTMLRPVNDLIDKFLHPTVPTDPPPDPQPPAGNIPNYDDLPLTPGSGMPAFDEMKKPPGIYPNDAGWTTETWWALRNSPRKDIELKCERIAYGVDVFKMRQTFSDQILRIISSSTYANSVDGKGDLLPNKTYMAVFNVWYWSDKGTTAYFADGSSGGEPPSNTRSVLPPSDRKVLQVKTYFKTDAVGKGCIALFTRGRCAVELGEFYHVRVADPKSAAGTKKR